jgi:hypothetical protein
MRRQSTLPAFLGYVISRNEPAQVQPSDNEAEFQIVFSHRNERHTLTLAQHAAPRFE